MTEKHKAVIRKIGWTLGVVAVLWGIACLFLYRTMQKPPEQFARLMSKIPGPVPFLILPFETLWMDARAGALQVGSPAPDFSLAKLDKSAQVQLASLISQGRPVVLVFGSYT